MIWSSVFNKHLVMMAAYHRIKSNNMVNCLHIIHFIFVSFDLIFNRLYSIQLTTESVPQITMIMVTKSIKKTSVQL